jgi:hypothetical protein
VTELDRCLARAAARGGPVGVMLHHAVMDEASLDALSALLALVARHPHARCARMATLCPEIAGCREDGTGSAGMNIARHIAALLLFRVCRDAGDRRRRRRTRDQRLKVSGTWDGEILTATRVQERDAGKDASHGQVEGAIGAVDSTEHSMKIGPLTVTWTEATTFDGLSAEELRSGVVVEVSGELLEPLHLEASAMESGSSDLEPDVVEIIGAVEETTIGGDASHVEILGIPS